MDSRARPAGLIAPAADAAGRRILAGGRGGASDASHFAPAIALTVDGLGPRGGAAHHPEEHVSVDSVRRAPRSRWRSPPQPSGRPRPPSKTDNALCHNRAAMDSGYFPAGASVLRAVHSEKQDLTNEYTT